MRWARNRRKGVGTHSLFPYGRRLRHGLFILAFALLLPRTVCVYSWECYLACFPICYEPMSRIRACGWLAYHTDWREVVWAPGRWRIASRFSWVIAFLSDTGMKR